MWGYIRHRRIYQSGVLAPEAKAQHNKQQETISKEELLRYKEDMLAAEDDRHKEEKLRIRASNHLVLANPNASKLDMDDSNRAAKSAYEREEADHRKFKDDIAAIFASS